MGSEAISPIQGTRARIVREDLCGVPVTGAGSLIVFDGFVEIVVDPQYEDGTQYLLKSASGALCVNERADDRFLNDDVDIQFCAICPDAVAITTGQPIIVSGAPASGTGFWVVEGTISARWSLEVWQADSQSCTGSQARYAYWAWPQLSAGRLMSFTVTDDVLEWRIKARSKKANTAWGTGPGTGTKYISAVPANGHRGFNIVRIDPPAVTGTLAGCGAVALT